MSTTETNYFIQSVKYRKRALKAEEALEHATIKYVKSLHDMEKDYEKNMRAKDADIARLLRHLGSAIYRLEEVWEMPEVAGDITSFYPEWLTKRLELEPVENKELIEKDETIQRLMADNLRLAGEVLKITREYNELKQEGLV